MKKTFTAMISLLLTAFMTVMLPGIHAAVEAETKKLQEEAEFNIGDIIEIESDSWVVFDDELPNTGSKLIKAGSYTLESIGFSNNSSSSGYWSASVDLETVGGGTYNVLIHFYNNQYVEADMDKRYKPTGIKCAAGEHALTALFKDDLSASAGFTVAEKENVPSDDAKPAYVPPKTGIE